MQFQGTGFFYTLGEELFRAIRIQLPVPFSGRAAVRSETKGEVFEIEQVFSEGSALAPAARQYDQPFQARVSVRCQAGSWTAESVLPPTRPWTIYIAQDKHLDYGWIHPVEKVVERVNRLTDYALQAASRTGFHWNFDTSIWFEEYQRSRPDRLTRALVDRLKTGRFELGALWLVPFPGYMSSEEILHSLMIARQIAGKYGFPVKTASLQEVPSLPWGMISLLAGAGIPYMVKGAYDLRNPHLPERAVLPLAWWEGPDGSRVLVKWDAYDRTNTWGGYAEAYRLWRSASNAERVKFIEDTLCRFDKVPDYPVDAILLAGTGFDEYPQTTAVTNFIDWFNCQGWAYPRLVDATWDMFWQDVERQVAGRPECLPVIRGDLGSSWEEWPAQLAHLSVAYRRARETVLAGQVASAVAARLDPHTAPGRAAALDTAWRSLLQFADHNIGGIVPPVADDMRDRKAMYAYTAAREGARALESGVAALAASVCRPEAPAVGLLVFNAHSWPVSAPVEVMVPEPGEYQVKDLSNGEAAACRLETRGSWPEHYLSFVAKELPPFGYRCYAVTRARLEPAPVTSTASASVLENAWYRLAIDPLTGALRSLVDRAQTRELVDRTNGYGANQFIHHTEGECSSPSLLRTEHRPDSLGERLIVETRFEQGAVRSTYTLYHDLPVVDILNEVEKTATSEPQCSWFAFPFDLPGRRYFYDSPGAVLRAGLQTEGGDLLPGAGQTCYTVQTFLAVNGNGGHVILASPDAHLVQFGDQILRNPTADSDPRQPLALVNVMNNFTRNDHATNQGGQTRFSFRFRIGSGRVPLRADAAVRFGGAFARPLAARWLTGGADAALPAGSLSFLEVSPENVVATGLKAAEDGRGWVLRLWECAGEAAEAAIDLRGLGATQAFACDLLEGSPKPLSIENGFVRLSMPARAMRAIRFK